MTYSNQTGRQRINVPVIGLSFLNPKGKKERKKAVELERLNSLFLAIEDNVLTKRIMVKFTDTILFPVQSGTVAPAFGQPGGGVQYLSPVQIKYLVQEGYLIKVN